MGSINRSHNEADGGVLLFQNEYIMLFCKSVDCKVGGRESLHGGLYLTTHRIILVVSPYKPNAPVKSLCAPFCAITKINLEQPIFGANYIEATVSDEFDPTKSFSFKLKFSKGGAIEFALVMNRAVSLMRHQTQVPYQDTHQQTQSQTQNEQFYQAPSTVYAPGYNVGFQLPTNQFPDQPPIGFIYTTSSPPPYPGLPNQNQINDQNKPQPSAPSAQYPA